MADSLVATKQLQGEPSIYGAAEGVNGVLGGLLGIVNSGTQVYQAVKGGGKKAGEAIPLPPSQNVKKADPMAGMNWTWIAVAVVAVVGLVLLFRR